MNQGTRLVESDRLYLRLLEPSDAEGNYLKWMADPEVTKYLESRFQTHTVETLRTFIAQMTQGENNVFCAVVLKHHDRHIGNVKLGPIDWVHKRADVGLLIGEKDCWGQGFGAEAYKLMAQHAFLTLNLHKVSAGCYAENEGSAKALERAGFRQEGRRRQHSFVEGHYTDLLLFGILNEEFGRQEIVQESLEKLHPSSVKD